MWLVCVLEQCSGVGALSCFQLFVLFAVSFFTTSTFPISFPHLFVTLVIAKANQNVQPFPVGFRCDPSTTNPIQTFVRPS